MDPQVWPSSVTVTTDPATGLLVVDDKSAARRVASAKGAAAAAQALSRWLPDEAIIHPVLTVDGPMLDRL